MKSLLTLVTAAILILSACGQPANRTTVDMDEWSMKLSSTTLAAGEVTFTVNNNGKVEHEIAILKTELAADKIPVRAADPQKVEEPGNVGEIEDIAPGTTKSGTFKLAPGNYVLICNVATHYQAGMHVPFVVR